MLLRTAPETVANTIRTATSHQLIDPADDAIIFIDLDVLEDRLHHLRSTFPSNTLHAPAIKAHPLLFTLEHIASMDFGLEAASVEEVALALAAGVEPKRIVFDSPAKTKEEIAWCIQHAPGLTLNANSLAEIDRIPKDAPLNIGLRINPLVDGGSPEVFHVSDRLSKFGVPLSEREAIIRTCINRPDIRGLHLHVGSEVKNRKRQAMAVGEITQLAIDIDRQRLAVSIDRPLDYIDIGGGVPARYEPGHQPGLEEYVALLNEVAPSLFQRYQVITEFGRFVFAHCGWLWSRIEYLTSPTADLPGRVILHAGADLFVREIYMPNPPDHQFGVVDGAGFVKVAGASAYDLAGPLCFGGDFLGRAVTLPDIEPTDQLIVRDIGANSFALWSRHCSRRFPKALAYSAQRKTIEVARPRETIDDILAFWKGTKTL